MGEEGWRGICIILQGYDIELGFCWLLMFFSFFHFSFS